MRVAVTGAGGQLGSDLVAWCTAAGDDVVALDHATLDVADRDGVMASLCSTAPDVVVHAAAWTAVDACEADRDRAFAVNALGTRWVAEASARVGAHLCVISTDYVFDGSKVGGYVEWDRPDPRSVYGSSKLAAEQEAGPDALVVRTSWVCGVHGANMVRTILRLAGQHDELAFVDDQRGHPTFTADLAPMLRRLVLDRRRGLYHVTNQGEVSWYEFARAVLEAAGSSPDRVRPIATAELDPPRPAARPANSVLDNAALRLGGIPLLRDFRDPLAELVGQLQSR